MLANDQRTTNLLEGPGGTDGFRVVDVSHADVVTYLTDTRGKPEPK